MHLKNTKEMKLRYDSLDLKSVKLYSFVDSGYNAICDRTTHLTMVVFLVDGFKRCHFLHCAYFKSQRVSKFILAGEVYAFSQGYDYGTTIMMMFKSIKLDVSLYIFTDSKNFPILLPPQSVYRSYA